MVEVLGTLFYYPMKMVIIQHKDFIEALFTNRSYLPFNDSIHLELDKVCALKPPFSEHAG